MRVVVILDALQHGSGQDTDGPGRIKQTARFVGPEYRLGPGVADIGAHRLAGESTIRNAVVLAEKRHNVGSAGQVGAELEREPVDCAWVKGAGHHGVLEGRWGATTR
jgi:hypothetical protein